MKLDVEGFFQANTTPLLTLRAECSLVTSKPAHLSPYLPRTARFTWAHPHKDVGGEFKNRARTLQREAKNHAQYYDSPPTSQKVSPLAFTRTGVKDSARTVHRSRLGDIGNEPLAESYLLDLPWGMAHIDDQPVDLQHPDEGVLINH